MSNTLSCVFRLSCAIFLLFQADAAKAAYYTAHIDPSSQEGRNGGAHFGYLDILLKASGSGFMVGSGLTAADLCVFDIVDLHVRIFPEEMAKDVSGVGGGLEGGRILFDAGAKRQGGSLISGASARICVGW